MSAEQEGGMSTMLGAAGALRSSAKNLDEILEEAGITFKKNRDESLSFHNLGKRHRSVRKLPEVKVT